MIVKDKLIRLILVTALLTGCAASLPADKAAHLKGEQLNIRDIVNAHPDKRGCVDYQAATNSCAAIFTVKIDGDDMTTHETAALLLAGGAGTQYIETVKRSTLRVDTACITSGGISVPGRDEMSAFVLGEARDALEALGGSACSTYYRSGVEYVASTVGANGAPDPNGDVQFQFISGDAKLRAR